MTFSLESEHREFSRVSTGVPVEYRFFSDFLSDPRLGQVLRGATSNLGGGGLLLQGPLPDPGWVPDLLLGKINLALRILLPGEGGEVKALARVVWIEDPGAAGGTARLGLRFREITVSARDRLLKFVIDARTPGW